MGACLGSGRAKFECILYGLGDLEGSPEGWTGGGGMGRAMGAGVRVGLFVCLCSCRNFLLRNRKQIVVIVSVLAY